MITQRTIIVGLDLDGVHLPMSDGLLVSRMGPQAFLEFLEVHSGFQPINFSQSERIAAFMAVLRENESSFPSFYASWKNAPLATAKELLGWIDTWYLHGWNGCNSSNDSRETPKRFAEIAEIESMARGHIGTNTGRRLMAVATAIKSGVSIPINRVELVDDIREWPKAWQIVFGLLPCSVREWADFAMDDIPSDRIDFLVCDSTLTAARKLAEFSDKRTDKSCCAIIENERTLCDEIAAASGRPEAGIRESAGATPASQVLPLALALHKEPGDLNALLSFLSHPVCPMAGIQYGFAEAIAATGGIHNDEWDKARLDAEKKWSDWGKDPAKLDDFIEYWIPAKRETESSFSRARAIEVTKRVIAYLGAIDEEKTGAAIVEAALFIRTLESLGPDYDAIPWAILADFLSLCGSTGNAHPFNREAAQSLPTVKSAGALIDPVDSLMWFMPQPANRADPWPWTKNEICALRANGCELTDVSALNSRPLRMMLRACSLIKGSLTVIVSAIRGDLSPVELAIASVNNDSRVEPRELEHEILKRTEKGIKKISDRALPPVRRWWKLQDSLAPDGKWKTSYSQLSTFIDRPAQWLLEKKAGIQNGTILSLPEETLRRGTCAHALVERLFTEKKDSALLLAEQDFALWFNDAFTETLEKYGYSYLERGASREKINYKHTLFESVRILCEVLRNAGAKNVRLEHEVSGSCCGAALWGSIDLVFDKPDGSSGLVDMKYSSWKGYIDKMATDADMQLTLYSELYRQENKTLPESAYWLFPAKMLIARNASFFPGAKQVASAHGHDERMAMIEASVDWRRKELAKGDIEVVCAASDAIVEAGEQSASAPPDGGLPRDETRDGYDPYLSLYGWEPEA